MTILVMMASSGERSRAFKNFQSRKKEFMEWAERDGYKIVDPLNGNEKASNFTKALVQPAEVCRTSNVWPLNLRGGRVNNVITGHYEGIPFTAFDFQAFHSFNAATYASVAVVHSPTALPVFQLRLANYSEILLARLRGNGKIFKMGQRQKAYIVTAPNMDWAIESLSHSGDLLIGLSLCRANRIISDGHQLVIIGPSRMPVAIYQSVIRLGVDLTYVLMPDFAESTTSGPTQIIN